MSMNTHQSKHFTLHLLTDGVVAAIASDRGAAIGNAGLIALGGQVLLFDTFMTPQAALDLRRAVEALFGRAPNLVVNSHYHNDHIWGNQVFADSAHIISTTRTRELIASAGKEEFDYYLANSAARLESIRMEYNKADENQRADLAFWIPYYEGLVEALPTLQVVMPDLTFDRRMEIHGGGRKAELFASDNAHTGNDAILYLPQDGIVFMSDLLFVGCHPYLADGDPLGLLSALREIEKLDAAQFVPGHGSVGTRDDLVLMIEYVEHCLQLAQELRKAGGTSEEKIAALEVPEPYHVWRFPKFFQMNMQFLVRRSNETDVNE